MLFQKKGIPTDTTFSTNLRRRSVMTYIRSTKSARRANSTRARSGTYATPGGTWRRA